MDIETVYQFIVVLLTIAFIVGAAIFIYAVGKYEITNKEKFEKWRKVALWIFSSCTVYCGILLVVSFFLI